MATDQHVVFHPTQRRGLEPDSHTAEKLHYASPHHMHMTSRRFFIGPIPQGWLQNHRKSWWKTRIKFGKYSSKTVTFSADPIVAQYSDDSEADQDPSTSEQEQGALTDTTEDEGAGREQDDETSDQEAHPERSLRTVPYTLAEGHDISHATTTASDNSMSASDSNQRNWDSSTGRQDASSAYYTARELDQNDTGMISSGLSTVNPEQSVQGPNKQTLSTTSHHGASQLSPMAPASDYGSTTALLRPESRSKGKQRIPATSSMNLEQQEPEVETTEEEPFSNGRRARKEPLLPFSRKAAKHNLDDNLLDKQQRVLSRISRTQAKFSRNLPRRRKMKEGEVIKAEKMLVRIEETVQEKLPDDYSENDSYKMETRVVDHWREYLVACRLASDEDAPFSLQMYKTRVIPQVQKAGSRVSPCYEVPLGRKKIKVNLYSHLDKSIVLWGPCKRGTKIYIVRPRSSAHAAEWFTFLCQIMGRRRPSSLPIHVPDLGVSLVFNNPFEQLEVALGSQKKDTGLINRTIAQEDSAAQAIIRGCLKMLEDRPEWAEVLHQWSKTEIMGLAWKRYDRLEWIFGANEEKMYGSLAMYTTHDLELRPKQHYTTYIKHDGRKEDEPQPVEGFLVRLTSQRGVHQRMNKMFFKRLYFFTQDHYLFFCRPSRSLPPAPPKLSRDESELPSTQQILDASPLSYDIDPYPLQDGEISWLCNGNKEHIKKYDEEAYVQRQRDIHNLEHADGFIDLSRVQEVRHVRRDSCPADPNIREGPDVEFNPEARDTRRDDGATQQFNDERTFEMVLDNTLVVRFQAYNDATKDEWMKRLDFLVKYWKARIATDAAELKALRRRNQELLGIDEELESIMGQFGKKWEVKKAEASPLLHNICTLSGCRTINMSGQLFRKPRRHSTFKLCHVVLSAGKLLIFRSSLRRRNGVEIPHIHQNLETSIDLNDCYIYSGLLTDSDQLYSNQTFDSNHPGHRSLPRVYLSPDVYTNSDEDTAITFVIWQPLKKNLFRAREHGIKGQTKQRLKHVSALGVHGRTIVFKARSRVEKDRWVLSIASEIDRLQEDRPEDVRIIT
ncbi:hypothetical protein BO70DRAFT_357252 [Aspergillus heteromorphus CBS 117.55]|uniref:PH domain-containing protein n=1 Tax=Aspergillus heteromorphus CBS 117.55 TaxID=1448321 RepID=A0A317X0M5_9EURO|nr:uncharacterized protein BO70DRAFT_357252 [Aspergillus heteromorphus CBS 117.55]PWY92113.1 hypothetical protein BO70DRAFT_357252 [Aspergillus heteromorphus CBS 117.55]